MRPKFLNEFKHLHISKFNINLPPPPRPPRPTSTCLYRNPIQNYFGKKYLSSQFLLQILREIHSLLLARKYFYNAKQSKTIPEMHSQRWVSATSDHLYNEYSVFGIRFTAPYLNCTRVLFWCQKLMAKADHERRLEGRLIEEVKNHRSDTFCPLQNNSVS